MPFLRRHRQLFLYLLIVTQGGCFLDLLCDFFNLAPLVSRPIIEENLGQASAAYRYYAKGQGMSLLFGDDGVTLSLPRDGAVRLALSGADKSRAEAQRERVTRVHYLIGSDESKWIRNVRTFEAVRYRNVYRGINMVFHSATGDGLEQDFELAPGADPKLIHMRFDGANGVQLSEDGSLRIQAGKDSVVWQAPLVYQVGLHKNKLIPARYTKGSDGSFGFELGAYDRSKRIVIDPVITYATYVGSAGNDGPGRMVVDAQGNAYLASSTNDPVFPVSPGAFTRSVGINATITKMNAAGTDALFITHFGGTSADWGASVAVDRQGGIYLCGATTSPDFPTTSGALRTTVDSGDRMSGFVVKLNAAGSQLAYGTYLAGSQYDSATAIAVDGAGNAFVAGMTNSNNFPATVDAFQPQFRASGNSPGFDAFVMKLNPTGSRLIYGTFLGGSSTEYVFGLAIDASGAAYVSGATSSPNFPVSKGALQSTFAGFGNINVMLGDAFVSKISPDGSTLVYSTYLGGRNDEAALSIAVDAQGNAYVGGSTTSNDFPTTAGALHTLYRGSGGNDDPAGDGFVAKINPTGTALIYSTYLGGSRDDRVWAVAVEANGSVWAAGHTLSRDFAISPDAAQKTYGGERMGEAVVLGDAFAVHLNPAGSAILYSTYHGGSGNESAGAVAVAPDGSVLVSGLTSSANLPVTAGAWQGRPRGGDPFSAPALDGFLLRLADAPVAPALSISSVANEASGDSAAVAPGTIVVIDGLNLATSADVVMAVAEGGILPKTVAGSSVFIDSVRVPLLSVSAQRIVAIVPFSVAGKASVSLFAESNGSRSPAVILPVVQNFPGIYGTSIRNEEDSRNDADHPAGVGTLVTFRMTGAGQTDPSGEDGRIAQAEALPVPVTPVIVAVGDQGVEVVSVSGIPGEPAGRMQVVIRVPLDLASGEYPLLVLMGDIQSQGGVRIFVAGQ